MPGRSVCLTASSDRREQSAQDSFLAHFGSGKAGSNEARDTLLRHPLPDDQRAWCALEPHGVPPGLAGLHSFGAAQLPLLCSHWAWKQDHLAAGLQWLLGGPD